MEFTKTTCTRREPSFTRAKKSSGTWETNIADTNWSLFIPVRKDTLESKLCACVFPLVCLFLYPPSGSGQIWFSANFVPLVLCLLGLFDCTYIPIVKPLLTLPNSKFAFSLLLFSQLMCVSFFFFFLLFFFCFLFLVLFRFFFCSFSLFCHFLLVSNLLSVKINLKKTLGVY